MLLFQTTHSLTFYIFNSLRSLCAPVKGSGQSPCNSSIHNTCYKSLVCSLCEVIDIINTHILVGSQGIHNYLCTVPAHCVIHTCPLSIHKHSLLLWNGQAFFKCHHLNRYKVHAAPTKHTHTHGSRQPLWQKLTARALGALFFPLNGQNTTVRMCLWVVLLPLLELEVLHGEFNSCDMKYFTFND